MPDAPETAGGPGFQPMVAAMNRTLGSLGQEIAKEILTQSAAATRAAAPGR